MTFFLTYLLTFFLAYLHDRGWGPARNTELTRSRLRSGKEHWAHIIAVDEEEEDEEEEAEEKTTHIKSNNPHLTGEKNT